MQACTVFGKNDWLSVVDNSDFGDKIVINFNFMWFFCQLEVNEKIPKLPCV